MGTTHGIEGCGKERRTGWKGAVAVAAGTEQGSLSGFLGFEGVDGVDGWPQCVPTCLRLQSFLSGLPAVDPSVLLSCLPLGLSGLTCYKHRTKLCKCTLQSMTVEGYGPQGRLL